MEKEEKQELQKRKKESEYSKEITKMDSFTSIEEMLVYADVLIKSGLVPDKLKKPEQIVTIILLGKELGIPALSALSNINNIQGKPTLGLHAFTALARLHNVDWELEKDCLYVHEDGYESRMTNKAIVEEHGIAVDKVCQIRFFRYNPVLKRVVENVLSFTVEEARKQELMDKDNWKRMTNIMLRARTLVLGVRFVASDVFLGIYETSEMLDAKNKTYDIDEDGNVINM